MTESANLGALGIASAASTLNIVELDGRTFAPAQQVPIPEWPCTTTRRQQPTLTIKDNDLFLITNTLGNIACGDDQVTTSLGLFCRDTRFLSRLELQFEGLPPVLLSSTSQRGFALSVLCANPYIAGDDSHSEIRAETIGIQRDLVLQGGLFEELALTNYSTEPVEFELSLSFDADFADLFEIRGRVRQHTGTLLRSVHLVKASADATPLVDDGMIIGDGDKLTLAYQGVDQLLMESRIQFYQRPPDQLKGYTAIWRVALQPQATEVLGYRLQPFLDNYPASTVGLPATLHQAVAAETMEEQQWREGGDVHSHRQPSPEPDY